MKSALALKSDFMNLSFELCSRVSLSTYDLSVALGNQHSSSSRDRMPIGWGGEGREGRGGREGGEGREGRGGEGRGGEGAPFDSIKLK